MNDTIRIRKRQVASGVYDGFYMSVNGQEVIHLLHNYYFYEDHVKLYTLQDGTVMSIFTCREIIWMARVGLYVYGNGRLNQVLNFQTFFKYGMHNTGEVLKVSGNRLKVKFFSMSQAFAGIDMKYTYQYKNGRLIPVTKYGKVKVYKKKPKKTGNSEKIFLAVQICHFFQEKNPGEQRAEIPGGEMLCERFPSTF